ncbi:AI-2E family transporter [Persicobacter psychrovividus]|uniref:Pheromone autoinducer 2 transporter n=1 Tax=Persicobacter psychrovividus TaxID=387638 RepID=A0ABN6LI39_9BACT|nr:pheromone autoinducer 2 transporter [Persicobacter psychrovividus]
MKENLRIIRNCLIILTVVVIAGILTMLSSIFVPLVLALFLAILFQPIMDLFTKWKFPTVVSVTLIVLILTTFIVSFGAVVIKTGTQFGKERQKYFNQIGAKMEGMVETVNKVPGLHDFNTSGIVEEVSKFISFEKIWSSAQVLVNAVGDFSSAFVIMLLYLLALLGGSQKYTSYFNQLQRSEKERVHEAGAFSRQFLKVQKAIVTYIKVKTKVSLLTGVLVWLACVIFGVDFAVFWGFLAFTLNFIPSIGSIIATVPPVLLGLVQIESSLFLLIFSGLIVTIQFFCGNILEPKLQGKELSLNTVTVIFGLVFWGYIWGITGMLLSVPLMVILKMLISMIPGSEVLIKLMESPEETDCIHLPNPIETLN